MKTLAKYSFNTPAISLLLVIMLTINFKRANIAFITGFWLDVRIARSFVFVCCLKLIFFSFLCFFTLLTFQFFQGGSPCLRSSINGMKISSADSSSSLKAPHPSSAFLPWNSYSKFTWARCNARPSQSPLCQSLTYWQLLLKRIFSLVRHYS